MRRRANAITSAPAPHRAAFGRCRDTKEDRAENQEDQRQRRDQHERHAFGHPRQQSEFQDAVEHREQESYADADAHRDDDQLVSRRRGGPCLREDDGAGDGQDHQNRERP
jgi:hypothetical protein